MLGKRLQRLLFVLSMGVAAAGGYVAGSQAETAAPKPPPITPLLVTSETIMGEPIVYPAGAPAEITAAVMTLPPGGETPVHVHNVPVAGIVLEGEITVDYGEKGKRTFRQGEAIAEAMLVPHKGTNPTGQPVRIFVLFMGAKGVPTTTKVER